MDNGKRISFDANAALNEYIFARVIEDHNMDAVQRGGNLITATEGRRLHSKLLDKLDSIKTIDHPDGHHNNMSNTRGLVLLSAIRDVLRDSKDIDIGTEQERHDMYHKYLDDFKGLMQWDLTDESRKARLTQGITPSGGYIPVSPFDERYAHRSTVLNHGTEILYMNADTELGVRQKTAEEMVADGPNSRNMFKWTLDDSMEHMAQAQLYSRRSTSKGDRYKAVGELYSAEDACGLSRLRPYLSDVDYKKAAPWMTAVRENERMSQRGMDSAVEILAWMQNNGIPYKVDRDKHQGQLKATISGTKLDIRLTEKKGNEKYVGRMYNDGVAVFLDAASKNYTPSAKETIKAIEYTLGRTTERENITSGKVGASIGSGGYMRSSKGPNPNRVAFMSERNGKTVYNTVLGFTDEKISVDRYGHASPALVRIKTSNNRSQSHLTFDNPDSATDFLQNAVTTARERFEKEIDVDRLIKEAEQHGGEEDYVPLYSGNAMIAPMQRMYWEALTTGASLKKITSEQNTEVQSVFAESGLNDDGEIEGAVEMDLDDSVVDDTDRGVYTGDQRDCVHEHLKDTIDMVIGAYEPDADGKRFNPAMVSVFMESPFGQSRNNDNMVAAMRKLEWTGDELRGTDFQTGRLKDQMLRFDEESAVPMKNMESPFMQHMFHTILDTVGQTACTLRPEDVLIDKNGVVSYRALQAMGAKYDKDSKGLADTVPVYGQIGQIFEPDEKGVVETKYNGSENKLFTPGYTAYFKPKTAEDEQRCTPLMERLRLQGLEQKMAANIAESIRSDLMSDGELHRDENGAIVSKIVGSTTNINGTYRGLYSTVYKVQIPQLEGESLRDTYERQAEMTHLVKPILEARYETARGQIRLPSELAETIDTALKNSNGVTDNPRWEMYNRTNDNSRDDYALVNHSNLVITAQNSEGWTDPVMTGSGKNQGMIRFLAAGTHVTPDGRIERSDDMSARTALVNTPMMRYVDNIPADRVQMVCSNLATASGVAGTEERTLSDGRKVTGVGIAQLTVQGLTFDDGAIISKDFADEYKVIGKGGKPRPLMAGDKICDCAGNKSIVAMVIDRNADLDEAKQNGLGPVTELFAKNPNLDVVQAPYSAASRFNAAGYLLAHEQNETLHLPDGRDVEGGLGYVPMIITHHTANEHTREYDEEDVKSGLGRKVSAQLSWALCAKDATHIMDEVFSPNNSAVINMRETLNVMGLDISETGELRKGYQPHEGEERYIFRMPSEEKIAESDRSNVAKLFREQVDSRGGFLEIPFEMKLPSGVMTQPCDSPNPDYPGKQMYMLPVMSAHLRSGQTFQDGTSQTHDYTNQYIRIFQSALDYMDAEKANDTIAMNAAKGQADTSFATITESIRNRKFDTKHNMFRDELMSRRVPNSATAVWTPDTRLDLNQIAMNKGMMDNLGVKNGDYVLLWRDPILRDYGAKYMQVVENNDLTGVAVHPLIAVAMDGDFDGDSVGLFGLSRESSKREAMEKFSFEYTILDTTKVRENGDYALMINDSMDVISAEAIDEKRKAEAEAHGIDYGPSLHERRMLLEHTANEQYRNNAPLEDRKALMHDLSHWAHDCLNNTCGTEVVSYKDMQSHMESLISFVDRGAKGSHKKLGAYAKYLGAEFQKDKDGRILPETIVDTGHPLVDAKDVADTELATGIKSHGTGIAGTRSQVLVAFARNMMPEGDGKDGKDTGLSAGMKLTYLSTQGLLQAKHDPEQAKRLYDMVQGPVRNIWRGRSMEAVQTPDGLTTWQPKAVGYNPDGTKMYEQATKEEWINMFMEMHEHPDGFDLKGAINREHVAQVADILCDPKTGRMYDIEDPETIYQKSSVMDTCAYHVKNSFETLCRFANDGRNVFEGEFSQRFAPKQIRDNMRADELGEPLRPIVARDVTESYDPVKKHGLFDVNLDRDVRQTAVAGVQVADEAVYEETAELVAVESGVYTEPVKVEPVMKDVLTVDESVVKDVEKITGVESVKSDVSSDYIDNKAVEPVVSKNTGGMFNFSQTAVKSAETAAAPSYQTGTAFSKANMLPTNGVELMEADEHPNVSDHGLGE